MVLGTVAVNKTSCSHFIIWLNGIIHFNDRTCISYVCELFDLIDPYFENKYYLSRFKISIIKCHEEFRNRSINQKLNNFRRMFSEGSFLVCYERVSAVTIFHLDISVTDGRCEDSGTVKESNFETSTSIFQEMSCFKSNLNCNAFQEKCFIVIGFNLPDMDAYEYFMENWRELTGVGNLLTFLTPQYFIGRVSLLSNSTFEKPRSHFHFIVLVEIFFNRPDYIYLLDYVQQFRVKRNFGFISIYGEFPAEPIQNHPSAENHD